MTRVPTTPDTDLMPSAPPESPSSKGERTRQTILDRAAALASESGLESLSIGALADDLGLSKSGLFAHFGSKEELQLETIERARTIFVDAVIRPALEAPEGRERLVALCEHWLSYAERRVFPGGCFFSATTAEFENRPGPVRDRLAALIAAWLATLERSARAAQEAGELSDKVEPARIGFELFAVAKTANWNFQLFGDPEIFASARASIRERLAALSQD